MFSVRIVTTDHHMAPPLRGLDVQYADQRGAEVKKVPVVRIFGATPAGNSMSLCRYSLYGSGTPIYDDKFLGFVRQF